MKKLFLLLLIAGTAYADGPLFRFKDSDTDQEVVNIYQTIRNPNIDFGTAKILNITTSTIRSVAISSMTASSATIKNLTVTGTATGTFGKLVQLQVGTKTTSFSTTNTSPQATGLTVSITPTSASNKVLIIVSTMLRADTNLTRVDLSLYRGGSNVDGTNFMMQSFSAANSHICAASFNYLDSPASTSALTYEVYLDSGNGNSVECSGNNGGFRQSIIAVEIAS